MISVEDLVKMWTDVERARQNIVRYLREHSGVSTTVLRAVAHADRISAQFHSAALRTLEDDGTICSRRGPYKNGKMWRLTSPNSAQPIAARPETDTESGPGVCLTSEDPGVRGSALVASALDSEGNVDPNADTSADMPGAAVEVHDAS